VSGSPGELTAEQVEQLGYAQLVSLVGEVNRPPGGKRTVRRIAELARLDSRSRVLEVGCTTGFTSVELAVSTAASITGIDVEPLAVEQAERWRQQLPDEIAARLAFHTADVTSWQAEQPFDLVVTGGATSFIADKQAALASYRRLVRPYGLLSITGLYYRTPPPPEVVAEVEAVLGFPLTLRSRDDWLELFLAEPFFSVHQLEDHELRARDEDVLLAYVENLTSQRHLDGLSPAARAAVRTRWLKAIAAFNSNHRYLSYLLLMLRADAVPEQPELFVPPGQFDLFEWRLGRDRSNGSR
jgi:SAM-dependent methyltransferase